MKLLDLVKMEKILDNLLVPTEMNAKSRRIIVTNVKLQGKIIKPYKCLSWVELVRREVRLSLI